jgi:hypothetical protein
MIVETRKQRVGIRLTQSFNAGITTIKEETIVEPNIDVVKRGILIGFIAKLGSGSNGVLVGRNLNQSLALPITTTRVVGIPQMVFINLIMTIHVNKTINQPLMSSMVIGRCRIVGVVHSRGGY